MTNRFNFRRRRTLRVKTPSLTNFSNRTSLFLTNPVYLDNLPNVSSAPPPTRWATTPIAETFGLSFFLFSVLCSTLCIRRGSHYFESKAVSEIKDGLISGFICAEVVLIRSIRDRSCQRFSKLSAENEPLMTKVIDCRGFIRLTENELLTRS